MARTQTIFSEIYLAMAIANTKFPGDIINVKETDILRYSQEFERRKKIKSFLLKNNALLEAGKMLRNLILKYGISNFKVNWIGDYKLSGIESVAKDLEIVPLNWRVSVKENADVFINSSATTLFIDLPQGRFGQKVRGEDWFIKIALNELQNYYVSCEGAKFTGFANIQDYYNQVKGKNKKFFSKHVSDLHINKDPSVLDAYRKLCDKVSVESANIFNFNFEKFLKETTNNKNRLVPIFHFFFKINGISYYLVGSEKNKPFVVELPSSSGWIRQYQFLDVKALPKRAGQPEIILNFMFKNKTSNVTRVIPLKIEIRWSHGKFCGHPEAKVYKQWSYTELPWVKVISRIGALEESKF